MANPAVVSSFKPSGHQHQRCIEDALSTAEAICAARGRRLTPIRRRVLELVWAQHEPVGAYELLDRLRDEKRNAAPPTVYRALDFLLENGLVHRIETLNAFVGCGGPDGRHAGQFLICRTCGMVGELADPEIEALLRRKAGTLGFTAQRQTIEILGLCPDCDGAGADQDRAV